MSKQLRYENGALVGIPPDLADQLAIKSGDWLEAVIDETGRLILIPVRSAGEPLEQYHRMLQDMGLIASEPTTAAERPPASWQLHPPLSYEGPPLSEAILEEREEQNQ